MHTNDTRGDNNTGSNLVSWAIHRQGEGNASTADIWSTRLTALGSYWSLDPTPYAVNIH